MSEVEKAARKVRETLEFLWVAILIIAGSNLVQFVFGLNTDETDNGRERSQLILRTDHGTGCKYLETRTGAIIVRLRADGTQDCPDVEPPSE